MNDVVLGIGHDAAGLRRDQMRGLVVAAFDVPLPAVLGERVHIEQVRQPTTGRVWRPSHTQLQAAAIRLTRGPPNSSAVSTPIPGTTPTSVLRSCGPAAAHRDGKLAAARSLLHRGVEVARGFGQPSELVTALTGLAEVELDARDRTAARAALVEAREVVDTEPVLPVFVDRLVAVETRAGRGAVQDARHGGALIEELTDREQSVLRALTTEASQREIGASLYLSINTVKGYTKALYRKLGLLAVRMPSCGPAISA